MPKLANMPSSPSENKSVKNLKLAFFINLIFTLIELVGGLFTNSIAILSDALHDLGDSLSLGLAWILEKKAIRQKKHWRYSFGFARFRLLGALVNALVLIGGSIYIIVEAIERFQAPQEIKSDWMIGIAIIGVFANGYAAWRTKGSKSLNEKVISWHLLEDVLGWLAVLIVAIILQFKDWYFLDPALSIGVTLFILFGVGRRLWETMQLLLQAVPRNISLKEVKAVLKNVSNVHSIHHTHLWSLDGTHHVLTSHLVVQNISDYREIEKLRKEAAEALEPFEIAHLTLQVELEENCPTN